jgi:hypothetical protein
MFASLRARMVGAGVVAGLALPLAVAAPASAATFFWAFTRNEAASAELYYHYDKCDSAGYCHIKIENATVDDQVRDDGWGGVLVLHRKTRPGSPYPDVVDLISARDNGYDILPSFERNGHKDVWFEVCNWNPGTGQRYDCVRLHK